MASSAPWLGAERSRWLAEVTAWVHSVLSATAIVETVKERPWGAVLRVRTKATTHYFKAPAAASRHELRIIRDIFPRWPVLAPDVYAVDEERGWMLLADHGVPMRDVLDASGQVAVIEELLPALAEMQRSTLDCVPAWLAAGTPDRRLAVLPELLDRVLQGNSPIGALRLDDAERSAYLGSLPLFEQVCLDLADTSAPDALDHADLHSTNVLIDASSAHRLIDWGDACITHPFSTLLVPLHLVVPALPGHDERRQAILRLRDAYLSGWGSGSADREAVALAVWVAHVTRAINIAHETSSGGPQHDEITSLLRAWHAKRPPSIPSAVYIY